MNHVAIDLGGMESQMCIRDAKGQILEERRCLTRALSKHLEGRDRCRVVMETCAEAFHIADVAAGLGHEVTVVPSTLVRALGVGARGIKTDTRDARTLSEVSCRIALPSVHVPSARSRQLKSLCGMREGLIECRTKLINTVRGWLRTQALRIRTGTTETFVRRMRAAVAEPPSYVERQLEAIDALCVQIAEADREVAALAKDSEVCRRLMTIPGVGPVTSLRFVAAIDEIERFDNAHALQSYLGLTPGENSSSERTRRTGITKAGSPALRWALVQAAWAARRHRRRAVDPMVQWSLEVEKRRGKRIAIVALARKLAGVMYAVWRDASEYSPSRLLDDRARHTEARVVA